MGILTHSPASVKRHILMLLNKFHSMHDMVMFVLYTLGMEELQGVGVGGVGGMARRVVEFVVRQRLGGRNRDKGEEKEHEMNVLYKVLKVSYRLLPEP